MNCELDSRVTSVFMTTYERARILGFRAVQLSLHCQSTIQIDDIHKYSTLEIAHMEFEAKKIPVIVRRYLPNGHYEDRNANELITDQLS